MLDTRGRDGGQPDASPDHGTLLDWRADCRFRLRDELTAAVALFFPLVFGFA